MQCTNLGNTCGLGAGALDIAARFAGDYAMNSRPNDPAQPAVSRGWQFTIRSLLAWTLVLALLLGAWSDGARKRRDAVRAIEAAGGTIAYLREPVNESALKLCRSYLGCVVFGQPSPSVDLTRVKDVRAVLPRLKHLNAICSLNLLLSGVSDADLDSVAVLHSLEKLYLCNTRITDDALRQISGLPNLRVLSLCSTSVTDEGLRYVSGMTTLRELNVDNTRITDAGLRHLKGLHDLNSLNLSNCSGIDGSGLKDIAVLQEIDELELNSTRVSNERLQCLSRLKKLRKIWLMDTPADEEGVSYLRTNVPSLEQIDSGRTDCWRRDAKANGIWKSDTTECSRIKMPDVTYNYDEDGKIKASRDGAKRARGKSLLH